MKKSLTKTACYLGTTIMIAFIALMLLAFLIQSIPAWKNGPLNLLAGQEWFYRSEKFGMLSMIYGSATVALIAILTAAPLGIGAAIYTAEIAPRQLRLTIKAIIELLAGIPSVIYGILGIIFLRDWIRNGLQLDTGDTLLTAGILVGIMILPTVATLCDDALRAIPSQQRAASRALGLTRWETIKQTLLPQASSSIMAAILLALGRGVGETIAVMLVVGRQDNQLPSNPLDLSTWLAPGQTLTSKLGGSEINIAYGNPTHWGAISALALVLLIGVTLLTIIGRKLIQRAQTKGGAA